MGWRCSTSAPPGPTSPRPPSCSSPWPSTPRCVGEARRASPDSQRPRPARPLRANGALGRRAHHRPFSRSLGVGRPSAQPPRPQARRRCRPGPSITVTPAGSGVASRSPPSTSRHRPGRQPVSTANSTVNRLSRTNGSTWRPRTTRCTPFRRTPAPCCGQLTWVRPCRRDPFRAVTYRPRSASPARL